MSDFKNLPNCPFCGTPPDDMFESDGRAFCVPCDITVTIEDWKNVNKIKADTVKEVMLNCEAFWSDNLGTDVFKVSDIDDRADKLERGEI